MRVRGRKIRRMKSRLLKKYAEAVMNRIYLSGYYLQTLHYLFFSFAVLSMTAGMMFFATAFVESIAFLVISLCYTAACLLVAYRLYKNYEEIIEPFRLIKVYLFPYVCLAVLTIASVTFMVWIFPEIAALLYSFLFINYYMLFLILIGFVVGRFKVISRLFEVYDFYVLEKAKRLAKRFTLFNDVEGYKIGSDQTIDEILDELWVHRGYPVPYVRKLEKTYYERRVISISRTLNNLGTGPVNPVAGSMEKLKKGYIEKIMEIEKKTD
jgi:hypothetical protein